MSIASDDNSAYEAYARHEEEIRVDRWWATYNAALSGIYSNTVDYGSASPIDTHDSAVRAANLAHGPLKP